MNNFLCQPIYPLLFPDNSKIVKAVVQSVGDGAEKQRVLGSNRRGDKTWKVLW